MEEIQTLSLAKCKIPKNKRSDEEDKSYIFIRVFISCQKILFLDYYFWRIVYASEAVQPFSLLQL